jgi:hypothetical protein
MCAMMQKFRINSGGVNVWSAKLTLFLLGRGALIVPRATAAGSERVRALLGHPLDVAAGVTISVGVARAPLDDEPAAVLSAANARCSA